MQKFVMQYDVQFLNEIGNMKKERTVFSAKFEKH